MFGLLTRTYQTEIFSVVGPETNPAEAAADLGNQEWPSRHDGNHRICGPGVSVGHADLRAGSPVVRLDLDGFLTLVSDLLFFSIFLFWLAGCASQAPGVAPGIRRQLVFSTTK